MIASLLPLIVAGQSYTAPNKWPAQWRDPYSVRIGGARLGMTQAEFDQLVEAERRRSPNGESKIAKMHTTFNNGRLMGMQTNIALPNSNIPMPGTSIEEFDKVIVKAGLFSRGAITTGSGTRRWRGTNRVTFMGGNEISWVSLYENNPETWGVTLLEDYPWGRDHKTKSGKVTVINHRSRPIRVNVEFLRTKTGTFVSKNEPYVMKILSFDRLAPSKAKSFAMDKLAIGGKLSSRTVGEFDYEYRVHSVFELK